MIRGRCGKIQRVWKGCSIMKVGFIGCGNMASAMIGGIIKNHLCAAADIAVHDVSLAAMERAKTTFGVTLAEDNAGVLAQSELVVLAVKPQFYEDVIREISPNVQDGQVIVTIAPGKTLAWLAETFGKELPIVRTMPNTPAMVGEGITAVCPNGNVSPEMLDSVLKMLGGFGKAEVIPERMMDAVVAVSGSSPAYIFMLIEAMADAAVAEGMPRQQAYTFAAQAVLGSAKMVLETGKHPGELKDMVCSPAGTTIEAVQVLEETGFRSSVMQAMRACAKKSRSM